MKFQEFLNENAIQMRMHAATKQEVLEQLCEMLFADGCIADRAQFLAAVQERETRGMTGIGRMIAIPHGRSRAVLRSCAALARLDRPVIWETLDRQPVRVVLLFAIREDQNELQLQAMAAAAQFLGQETYQRRLLHCRSNRELRRLLEEMPEGELDARLRLVAVTACPAGVAHTYIAKECLVQAALARHHRIKVETQGAIGVENRLTEQEIRAADVVILAADTEVDGMERFEKKRTVRVPVSVVIRSAGALLEQIEKRLENSREGTA